MDNRSRTLLHLAAISGSTKTVEDVVSAWKCQGLDNTEMDAIVQTKDEAALSALGAAVRSKETGMFRAVMNSMRAPANDDQMEALFLAKDGSGLSALGVAVKSKDTNIFNAVLSIRMVTSTDQLRGTVQYKNSLGETLLSKAIDSGNVGLFEAVQQCTSRVLSRHELRGLVTFKSVFDESLLSKAVDRGDVELFKAAWNLVGQRRDLIESKNIFGEFLLSKAVESGNVELFDAVRDSTVDILSRDQMYELLERNERNGYDLFSNLVAKAIERGDLGLFEATVEFSSVGGYHAELDYGRHVFEFFPKQDMKDQGANPTFQVKTGMDACADMFEPAPEDEETEESDFRGPLDMILAEQQQLETFSSAPLFILAGLVAAPGDYFHVPVMRMMLDLVVFLGMLTALGLFVLFRGTSSPGNVAEEDDIVNRTFCWEEGVCAAIFVVTGTYREAREVWRDVPGYFQDQWNILDALGLLFVLEGAFIRWVIFRMTSTLLKFGFVMMVVMIGFAMALHVLFRGRDSFGETFLGLFNAMLGDTGLFDEFSDLSYAVEAWSCAWGDGDMSSASHGAAEEADIAQNGAGSNAEKKGHSLEDLRGMIVEGKPNLKELKAALANKPSLLEGTYGGKDGGIDGSGLYPGTHPILHAALRGEKDIFSAIVDAIKTKEGDLRWYLREKDVFGRTVLQLAALGGCWQTFTEVKEACKDESNTTKWEMFTRGDSGGITTLMAAARGGNKKIFKFALNTTRDLLHHAEKKARKFLRRMKPLVNRSTRWAEMKGQLLRVDNQRRTLLQFAALSGSLETFEAVRKACEKEKLYKTEELEMFALGSNSASMTTLMAAVQGGNTDTFQTALSATGDLLESDEAKVKEHVLKRDGQNRTLLQLAAMKGQAMVDAVTAACREWHLTEDEIFAMRRSPVRDSPVRGAPKLMDAIITGKKEKFAAALRAAERKHREREHGESELRGLVMFKSFFKESLLSKAVDGGNVELFEAVWNFARKTLTHDQLCDLSKSENVFRECLWSKAVARGNVELLDVVRNSTLAVIPHDQVKNHLQSRIENDSELFSTLLMSVIERGDFGLFEAVVECWVRSPESSAHKGSESEGIEAENKDIEADVPGHKALLKEALKSGATKAAKEVSEGERRTIKDIQTSVHELLLEIFERLPRTVRGFDQFFPKQDTKDQGANPTFQVKNGMDACAAIFEPAPEGEKNEDSNFRGPLEMILSRQKLLKTFCAVPLVMDFLSSKFTLGLPDLSDTGGVLRYPDKLADLNGRMGGKKSGLVLGDGGKALSKIAWFRPRDCSPDPQPDQGLFLKCLENSATMLQAADAGVPNLTFFPGAQFILAGLVAAPDDYFKVPLMRMVLDLVVYIGVLTALGFFVLFPTSNDDFVHRESGWGEGVCATVFVVSGIYREAREMWRDPPRYVRDQWNVLDALGLLFLLIGLIIRWVDSASSWRPAFYALSAPLLVSRVLFFAQILPFQGPMIQVIFRMTTKILKFGFVMVVVMIGFAMALHVLFRGDDRFGETFLALFNAMLGDTDFFEDFSGERHDPVATILLVVYLFIVTIMLLNLLVAILSTSHSKVQDNVKLEFKVSKAHIIDNYQSVVNKDLLPAPFNLVQLVADLIKLVVKLMAMIVGFLPSLSSLPSLSNLCSCRGFRPRDSLFDTVLSSWSMLRKGPDGVGAEKLREFLEDPMDDTDVRQDEKEKSTTVEHIKFLRNRLESTTKKELNDLRHDVDGLRTDVVGLRLEEEPRIVIMSTPSVCYVGLSALQYEDAAVEQRSRPG
eukprot:g13669.t1